MIRLACIAAALMLLSACVGAADSPLANSQWHIAAIDQASAVSGDAHIRFAGARLAASAGCNQMGGGWRTEGRRLIAERLAQTEMWCENRRLMQQEQALATLLSGAPEIVIDGDRLTLRSGGHSAELRRAR